MGKRPDVLIVESRQNTRTFLEMLLSQEGLRVFSAVSLKSALLQLRVLQPDLIILGLHEQAADESPVAVQIGALSSAPLLALEDVGAAAANGDALPSPLNAGQLRARVAGLLNPSIST